ncbi:hypothetical protein ALC56_14736 [Trachymyrmex septentrionalis]|uniref:Aldehyde dehydrogenase domain-containing protein n=1 Tax=Trachymyrmex septentrionalis TaxID=34720 RepID=A0A195ESR5_9HYME|nr:hypothetical protein ALC56_14736 [Trachymyrmex septentrionalis]
MGPGPPAAPTRCITPAAPISAALPLLRTSRDGFRAILKPSYADHRPYPLNSRNFGPTCLLPSERYRSSTGGRIVPNTYFQTASIIEKNLSVFKSVCNHVDIITALLDHLYTNGIKMMFDSEFDTYTYIDICEFTSSYYFYKTTYDNETLNYLYYTIEMIVFEDSDLYAIITYLKIKSYILLQIKKIFIQESVKQKFLWLLEKNNKHLLHVDLPLLTFHSKNELVTYCKDFLTHFSMMSIWSEDITSAKTLAMKLQKDVIFINTCLEFGTDIKLPYHKKMFNHYLFCRDHELEQAEAGDKINLNTYTGSVYNHFYNGIWQKPVSDAYSIYNDNICAHATRVDTYRAIDSAIEAFESWSNLPINSRKEILNNLAYTLEHNGKYLLAKTVSKGIKLINKTYKNILTYGERLEMISLRAPRGVIYLYHTDEVTLFSQITTSLYFGNCIIVIYNKNSCNIIPYLNMFSTAEIPQGVINLISDINEHIYVSHVILESSLSHQSVQVTVPKNIILPFK